MNLLTSDSRKQSHSNLTVTSDKPSVCGILFCMGHFKNLTLTNISEEVWRNIVGYEGLYQISSIGRVKSLARTTPQKKVLAEKMLSQGIDSDGYPQVGLCKIGVVKPWKVHRLVCLMFHRNTHSKPCVNHKNGVKTDNRKDNLEWVTVKENTVHSYRMGLQISRPPKGAKHPRSQKVNQYASDGSLIASFIGVREAERVTGIDRCTILYSHDNQTVNKYGHRWEVIR